ncbi:MAG: PepSY domain-containing protein [Thermus sp.]|nr:PepSY domain-containing protein [Thermus oshimai]
MARPHMPFLEALERAQGQLPVVEKLELKPKPKPKEGLFVWEARGGGQEVWLDALTGEVRLRR